MAVSSLSLPQSVVSPPRHGLWFGDTAAPEAPGLGDVSGRFVDLEGERFYCIEEYDAMPPFFMTVVSATDLWLFVSSTGGLTAGRRDVEGALFPYVPVDRIHDAAGTSGGFSALLVTCGGRECLWEPFTPAGRLAYRISRRLYKSVMGHRLCFEEINDTLGVTFRTEWTTSERFGILKRSSLINHGGGSVAVRVLDGLRNLLPAGVPGRLQESMSCLTDAYKLAETVPGTSLAVYALTAAILDQAVAMESLRAAVCWCEGLPDASVLLTESQVADFRRGERPQPKDAARGVRGLYATCSRFVLEPGQDRRWLLAADQHLDQAAVVRLGESLRAGGAAAAALSDAEQGAQRLRQIVGSADGLQAGGDEMATASHFANVLFNVMRGGVFLRGYRIRRLDFARFLADRSRATAQRHAPWIDGLADELDVSVLEDAARVRDDPDLERLVLEYLPLAFSRRHGDPSRPWNRFSIHLSDADGTERLEYQGNWRDIFQNWEALGTSFPGFLPHMVAKFVNGSTIDGYNAYRVTRTGVEWEEPAPEDPWATIGYWGDHQVVYLLSLLEWTDRFMPGQFHAWLDRPVFAYTAVPYRIATYAEMRANPRSTITFLPGDHAAIRAREAIEGTDARLVHGHDGRVLHVTLAEKLLLVALVRLANLVPGGGIWMNTQRPEWNDANNALVGFGVSVVTLAQLRRYLVFCRGLFAHLEGRSVAISSPIAGLARALARIFSAAAGEETRIANDPVARRACVDQLSEAGSAYRVHVYARGLGSTETFAGASLGELMDLALPMVDASLRAARREDGLFHAYRLLSFSDGNSLPLRDLRLMLEGQVAVLGSGLLQPGEAAEVLRAMRHSPLYRADQHTYILYPDGSPAGFLERNRIAPAILARAPLLQALLDAGDSRLVCRDASGTARFHADLVNEAALESRLGSLGRDPRWAGAVEAGADAVRAAYEDVFQHRAFLGRSGTMFAYEGLGSVYWHMVSKLLVSVLECHASAVAQGHPAADALAAAFHDVRSGLGPNKSPAGYGAFPSDPYSHTPGHAGAQQPGMTGQAKEGILVRRAELGVHVEGGALRFEPTLLRASEFSPRPHSFVGYDAAGRPVCVDLPAGTLAFTCCGALVVYHAARAAACEWVLTWTSGATERGSGNRIAPRIAAGIFRRLGDVARLDVFVPVQPSA